MPDSTAVPTDEFLTPIGSDRKGFRRLSGPALFLSRAIMGALLFIDFAIERQRTLAIFTQLAQEEAALVDRFFGDIFIAADCVLRDVLGRVDLATEMDCPPRDPGATTRLATESDE